MLYHDPVFLWLFLPIFAIVNYALALRSGRRAIVWICIGSLIFYSWTEPRDLGLLIWITAVMMGGSAALARRRQALVFALSALAILAPLAWFKYANFAASVAGVGAITGIPPLPIGLSFYTFQALAFLGAAMAGRRPTASPLEGLAFLAFFPQLIAGPIVLPHELLPQLRRLKTLARPLLANVAVGGTLFVLGFAKMTLIAEPASRVADFTFDAAAGATPDAISAWIGTLAYAVQIYFDFSAYSDMAIGLARLFGIRLPVNFFSPYRSRSLIDFWRRWHITLGRFLSMALYVPMGGNRHGFARQAAAIVITMLIGGLWHGAGYSFLLWGLLHGIGLVIAHGTRRLGLSPPVFVGWAATTAFAFLAWVPFRAADLATTVRVWEGLAFQGVLAIPNQLAGLVPAALHEYVVFDGSAAHALLEAGGRHGIIAVAIGLLLALAAPNVYQLLIAFRPALNARAYVTRFGGTRLAVAARPGVLAASALAGTLAIALLLGGAPQAFLYFQF